jgi:hypothetical protein
VSRLQFRRHCEHRGQVPFGGEVAPLLWWRFTKAGVLVIMGQAITDVIVLVFVGAFIILGPIAFRNKVRRLRSGGDYPFAPGRDCQRCGGWGNINGVPCGHPPTRGPRAMR